MKIKKVRKNKYSIKTNPVFSRSGQFNKTSGGPGEDGGYCVKQTTDGGYIISGYTYSYGINNSEDVWLIKTDSDGSEIWNKTFGTPDIDWSRCVQQTTDGGYIITGVKSGSLETGESKVWLIKTDNDGNMMWDKTFGVSDSDVGYSVQQTTDGGYIMTGVTASYETDDSDVLLIKTDSNGNGLK